MEEIFNGKRWKEKWYNYLDGFICDKHYHTLIGNLKRTKESIKYFNSNRLHFLDKSHRVNGNPRSGYCSRCPNNIYDGSCKKTDTHHYFYMPIMFWACTEELCVSCHYYETFPSRNKHLNMDKYNILTCNTKMSHSIEEFF